MNWIGLLAVLVGYSSGFLIGISHSAFMTFAGVAGCGIAGVIVQLNHDRF